MKPYLTKFLPTEGEKKEGDYGLDTTIGEIGIYKEIDEEDGQKINDFSDQKVWSINISQIKIGCSIFTNEEFNQVYNAAKKFNS